VNSHEIRLPLLIAGEAKLEEEKVYLRQLKQKVRELKIEDGVRFLGGVYGMDKERLLADSLCNVLPSLSENFGNVVLESLAQGTPVIAAKGTPWESLAEQRVGSWIDANPENLRDEIKSLTEISNANYSELSIRCRRFVERKYSVEQPENMNKWKYFYDN
jgi:glycosyltransferase involved in cell wall biosynthesis